MLRTDNRGMSEPVPMLQMPDGWQADVQALADALLARRLTLAAAESCTGGLIAAACTALAGSSHWFERGFVTYSNDAKVELLGVAQELLQAHGAVSEQVARAMAQGALVRSRANIALAVTGIAGPGGAVPGKPVGTVWLAWSARPAAAADPAAGLKPDLATAPLTGAQRLQLDGDRSHVRSLTVQRALRQALVLARSA
jgi:nicotinamide-nucleotide amidase